ncbi:lysozyme inhibitor LprI family protein [Erwinia billingiae]|uniref:lysozyme inhibitor LprI family protein n=1 Tax=Erwinia billingiae TaxID=182337 RepID=UPI00320A54E6
MRVFIKAFFIILIFPVYVDAISQDEQFNYLKIKDEYIKSDAELNDLYKNLMIEYRKYGGEFYGQTDSRDVYLKKSQQVWIKMRDSSCDYETYESKAGTGFPGIYMQCLLDKTNQRIMYLRDNN